MRLAPEKSPSDSSRWVTVSVLGEAIKDSPGRLHCLPQTSQCQPARFLQASASAFQSDGYGRGAFMKQPSTRCVQNLIVGENSQ
jgi:hypothetical protein